jgi:hypothetical protein
MISTLPATATSIRCTALLKDLSHFPSSNMLYILGAKAVACKELCKVQPRSNIYTPQSRAGILPLHPVSHPCKRWLTTLLAATFTRHHAQSTEAVIRTALELVATQATPIATTLLVRPFGLLMKPQKLRLGRYEARESIEFDEGFKIEGREQLPYCHPSKKFFARCSILICRHRIKTTGV